MQLKPRHRKYLEVATLIAISNPVPKLSRMAAIIVENKQIVGVGFNRYKTSPLQGRFAKNELALYEHAEIHAIKNAIKFKCNMNFTKASIYVARVLRNDQPALAAPCEGCMKALQHYRFKDIFWTNEIDSNCIR